MKRTAIIITLAVLFLIAAVLIFYPDYSQPRMIKFLILSQVMFVLSIGIYWLARKLDFTGQHRRLFLVLLFAAGLARGIMLVGAGDRFYISDDVYRYIWDGRVNAAGINPFLYAPDDPELSPLREDTIYPHINHRWLPTIYPPMAQNIFLITYLIGGPTTFTFKIVSALFELLTAAALMVLLARWGVRRSAILLYLFSPLILIEFYLSAHLDILAMPFFIAALLALQRQRSILTGIFLGLAAMVKLYGFLFAPVLFFWLTGKDRWRFAAALAGAVAVCYAPYLPGSGGNVLGSLGTYLDQWQFNGSIFYLFKYALGFDSARYIVAALFVAWLAWLILRRVDIRRKLFATFAGYLVLTPTFFPWYFVWIYPFVLWNRSLPFLYLSGSVLLSYHVLIGQYSIGTWTPIIWLGLVSWLPFYILLIRDGFRNLQTLRK
ncbi:DUF2029 domain-containing protein [candidate division GN15 bacterium]|nr:DUF2029 domain-containing protein [candidate division GN15 bacterium]